MAAGLIYLIGPAAPATKSRPAPRLRRAAALVPAARPEVFAVVGSTGVQLALPAGRQEVYGIGYHQAYNPKSFELMPTMAFVQGSDITTDVSTRTGPGHPVSFVMSSRGRATAPTSSVDIAMLGGSVVKSPVSGVVAAVVPYRLYGRLDDFRVDITPAGNPGFTIALAHMQDIKVSPGQQVEQGATVLGAVRPLNFRIQLDDYLGQHIDHVHIQANPIEPQQVAR